MLDGDPAPIGEGWHGGPGGRGGGGGGSKNLCWAYGESYWAVQLYMSSPLPAVPSDTYFKATTACICCCWYPMYPKGCSVKSAVHAIAHFFTQAWLHQWLGCFLCLPTHVVHVPQIKHKLDTILGPVSCAWHVGPRAS